MHCHIHSNTVLTIRCVPHPGSWQARPVTGCQAFPAKVCPAVPWCAGRRLILSRHDPCQGPKAPVLWQPLPLQNQSYRNHGHPKGPGWFPDLPCTASFHLLMRLPFFHRFHSSVLPVQKESQKQRQAPDAKSCPFPKPYAGPGSLHGHFSPIRFSLHQASAFR